MTALNFPNIWIPNRRILAAPSLAMAHLKKDASSGHLVKNTDGHLVKGCTPCCSSTYTTVTATFASVALATCQNNGSTSGKMTGAATFAGTFTLTGPTNAWSYSALYATSTFEFHGNTTCSSLLFSSDRILMSLICNLVTNAWQFSVDIQDGTAFPFTHRSTIFSAFDFTCEDTAGIPNTITAYSVPIAGPSISVPWVMGKNGTVDLTFNP